MQLLYDTCPFNLNSPKKLNGWNLIYKYYDKLLYPVNGLIKCIYTNIHSQTKNICYKKFEDVNSQILNLLKNNYSYT